MPKTVYWDSCCFIGLIKEETGRYKVLRALYTQAEKGELIIVTSALTLSEVCRVRCEEGVGQPRNKMNEEGDKYLDRFFDNDFFCLIEVSPRIAFQARRLYRAHPQIRITNDAVHLATALEECVDEMHSYDTNDLLALSGQITNKSDRPLSIILPAAFEPNVLA